MPENNQPQGQQVQIKASDEVLQGKYSDLAQIGFTQNGEEFILDFLSLSGQQMVSRVILSPKHMKRLSQAIKENLERYERQFGTLEAGQGPDHKIGFRAE